MLKVPVRRWPLPQALQVARQLWSLLAPSCERIAIAGSVRRMKYQVGDIELVAIPKVRSQNPDMFGHPHQKLDVLDSSLLHLLDEGGLAYRLNSKGSRTYGPLNKLLVHLPSGIPVDIFTATAENWGMALVLRTGPKEFNIWMMRRFRQLGMEGHAYRGVTGPAGTELYCPNEADVFRLAGLPFIPPEKRAAPSAGNRSWPSVLP